MKIPHMRPFPSWYVLDADNQPVAVADEAQWVEWMTRNPSAKLIGMTQITSEVVVSTVFLGFDHRFVGDGPPLLFETMVFGGPLNMQQHRYSSYDDAETGHRVMVRKMRAAIGQKVSDGET